METNKEEIGRRIQQIRKKAGLKQEEFGKLLNLSKSAISSYESGNNDTSPALLARISEIGGVSLNWLITGHDIVAETSVKYEPTITEKVDKSNLPEPIKKAVQVLLENEDMAWELYATILERAEKKKTKGQ